MTTTAGRIRGQVAKILNPREIIINRGAEDGVEAGMRFTILDPDESAVTDPETDEVLGVIHRRKGSVVVSRVEPRLSFARTFGTRRVNVGGIADWTKLSRILNEPPRHETRTVTLRTDEPAWDNPTGGEHPVRTGDPVEQVLESEAAP